MTLYKRAILHHLFSSNINALASEYTVISYFIEPDMHTAIDVDMVLNAIKLTTAFN